MSGEWGEWYWKLIKELIKERKGRERKAPNRSDSFCKTQKSGLVSQSQHAAVWVGGQKEGWKQLLPVALHWGRTKDGECSGPEGRVYPCLWLSPAHPAFCLGPKVSLASAKDKNGVAFFHFRSTPLPFCLFPFCFLLPLWWSNLVIWFLRSDHPYRARAPSAESTSDLRLPQQ